MKKMYSMVLCSLLFFISARIVAASATFILPSGVEVIIVELPFKSEEFDIDGCSSGNYVCRINGGIPFGTASELPKTYVRSITISYQESSYNLDVSNMYNAWGDRPLEHSGSIRYFGGRCVDTKNCRVRGIFSDGAGSFVAEWIVENGVVNRTIMTNSNDVMNLFTKHIDPPEFD